MLKGSRCELITFDTKYDDWSIYDKIMRNCDIITIHVPLNAESFHMIDYCSIESMKKNPYIINTSRKDIVNEEAIRWGLANNKLRGFASDVNSEKEFINYSKTYITPHIGSSTTKTLNDMSIQSLKNLVETLKLTY